MVRMNHEPAAGREFAGGPSFATPLKSRRDCEYVVSAVSSLIFWPPISRNVAVLFAWMRACSTCRSGTVAANVLVRLNASLSPLPDVASRQRAGGLELARIAGDRRVDDHRAFQRLTDELADAIQRRRVGDAASGSRRRSR